MPLALSSDKITNEQKEEITTVLSRCDPTEDYTNDSVRVTESTRLADLIDERSRFIFDELKICQPTWLQRPATEWADDEEYCKFSDFVETLKVTNDVAERGIKFIQDFANSITKAESQLQDLIQLVEAHRKRVPDFSKASLQNM